VPKSVAIADLSGNLLDVVVPTAGSDGVTATGGDG
jgi:hypothetical protein